MLSYLFYFAQLSDKLYIIAKKYKSIVKKMIPKTETKNRVYSEFKTILIK